jgi:hypothetical protein
MGAFRCGLVLMLMLTGACNRDGASEEDAAVPSDGAMDAAAADAAADATTADAAMDAHLDAGDARVDSAAPIDASADSHIADASGTDGAVDAGPPPRNYVFSTSASFDPTTLGSAAEADVLCQETAEAGDERLAGRTYIAWLSDDSSDAVDRLGDASGWVRLDDAPFAPSRTALLGNAPTIYYPPRLDEHGNDIVAVSGDPDDLYVATGSDSSGRHLLDQDCGDWSSGGAYMGGRFDAGHRNWGTAVGVACSISARLLCLGVDYDSPLPAPPPPPAEARIVFQAHVAEPPSTPGLAGLDAICEAAAGGLDGTFRALVPTSTSSAGSRFSAEGGPWYRPDGVMAIADPAAFLAGDPPDAPLGTRTASGAQITANVAGSPVAVDETAPDADTTCDDWSDYTADFSFAFGRPFFSAAHYFESPFTLACSNLVSLYCMAE